jgi:hypothetical protein
MTDYAGFKYGVVQYPLPAAGSGLGGAGASLLRDADPAIFYLLEFYKSILETHLGARFLAEVANCSASQIPAIVAETLPLDPTPYLTEEFIHFPLLAAYRKGSRPEWIGRTKHSVDEIEVVYVLPPMQVGAAERLLPALKAVHSILDNRTEQGFDPAYTPTAPTGTLGEVWWQRAGVTSAGVIRASYGGFAGGEPEFFPAITLTIEIKERSDFALSEFEELGSVDVNIDVTDPGSQTTVPDVVEFTTYPSAILTEDGRPILTEAGETIEPES